MHLLHFTQQHPTCILHTVYGSFTAPKAHELVVSRGRSLELFVVEEGRLTRVVRQDCFAHIRGLAAIRLAGQSKDCLVVSSDSGRLSFLSVHNGAFKREACETYGKWSMRRVVPGQFLASDPKGRAVMLAAVEKDKLVFVINRNAEDKLVVSSPLEANKQHAVTFCVVGLDVGYDNPLFAAIEVVYDDGERESKDVPDPEPGVDGPKEVVFYELDLGLNHVVRKSAVKIDASAHCLVAVPGGVLVCSHDGFVYVRPGAKEEPARVLLPKRAGEPVPVMVVSHAAFAAGDTFFALLQTERGDLFKVVVDPTKGTAHVKYFDTVAPSTQLCITLHGLLFVAAEVGDHELYQFRNVGDDPDDDGVEAKSGASSGAEPKRFTPRGAPRNLDLFDTMHSLAPLVGMQIDDLAKADVPQLYCASGTGARSTMRVLRQGLAVAELASIKLAGTPKGVWTVRNGDLDALIVVSYQETTMVLAINESRVEEVKTSGLALDVSSVFVSAWGRGQLIQVTKRGFSRIDVATGKELQEPWKLHGHKGIDCASVNERQMALALTGGEVLYFEADGSGAPVEVSRYDNGVDIASIDVGVGGASRFLALGSVDQQAKVMSLERASLMTPLSTQLLPERAASICLAQSSANINEPTRLEIGLNNGLLVRSTLDASGVIVDTRTHVLGSRPVRCQRVRAATEAQQLTLCCTSRPWLARSNALSPLSFVGVDFAAPFASEHAKDGLIVVSGRTLRVVTLDSDFEQRFNEQTRQLAYTPRRFVAHPNKKWVVVLEGEHGSQSVRQRRGRDGARADKRSKTAQSAADMDVDEDELEDDALPTAEEKQVGYARASHGWASVIRVLDPTGNRTVQCVELDADEVALSLELCAFGEQAGEMFLAVGTVTGYKLHPGADEARFAKAHVRLYHLPTTTTTTTTTGRALVFVNATEVHGMPTALCAFDGRLLAGVGNSLVLYDLGKKQMLKKCELKGLPNQVAFVKAQGSERVVFGDASDSCFFALYSRAENTFTVFADDVTGRLCTASADMVDYNTVAVGDKNGNVFILRLPPGATGEDVKSRAAAQRPNLWDQAQTASVPHKLDLVAHFYLGETVTSLRKCQLSVGHSETLVYSTVLGTVGTLCPFASRDDLDFFAHLELHMRKHFVNLVGRDHLQFRSYYAPCKQVVDGDLCEQYAKLDLATQSKIAKEMDRTPLEVAKRIEDARALVMW